MTGAQTKVQVVSVHSSAVLSHEETELGFWWPRLQDTLEGKRTLNIVLTDTNCELHNDDEDAGTDPTGSIGGALRRRRDARHEADDAADNDNRLRRSQTDHITDQQRCCPQKIHSRHTACNTFDAWWASCNDWNPRRPRL